MSPMHTMIAFLGLNFVILLGSPKIPSKNAFLSQKWNKAHYLRQKLIVCSLPSDVCEY